MMRIVSLAGAGGLSLGVFGSEPSTAGASTTGVSATGGRTGVELALWSGAAFRAGGGDGALQAASAIPIEAIMPTLRLSILGR